MHTKKIWWATKAMVRVWARSGNGGVTKDECEVNDALGSFFEVVWLPHDADLYIYIYVYIYIYLHIHIYISISLSIYICTHSTCIYTHIYVYIIYIYTCIYTYMYEHIYTHIHIHIYIYIYISAKACEIIQCHNSEHGLKQRPENESESVSRSFYITIPR